jgi:outer membrane PBP1 activator LpoA protein
MGRIVTGPQEAPVAMPKQSQFQSRVLQRRVSQSRALPGRTLVALLSAAALSAALLLAGCATTTVHRPTTAHAAPAFVEARAIAGTLASLPAAERQAGAARIDRLVAQLDDVTLAREAAALPPGDPLYDFAGRALLNRGLPLPRPFERNLAANASRPPAEADGYRPPLHLAVLLPLSGDLAKAAVPVRDGLLAGYYAAPRRRPDVRFYDTAAGVAAAYDRAKAAGADFIVGPLGRDEVGRLFGQGTLEVPVLALTRGSVAPPPGSASFSLAPEDDGIAAAEYLVAHQAMRTLVLADGDDGMRRAIAAFREQYRQRGGTVVAELPVAPVPVGMGGALAAAARTEGGVDAVFLAVRASQAVALSPQLLSAGLAGKLRVATSQLGAASAADAGGHALDGIAFPSDAWTLRNVPGLPPAAEAASLLASARGPAQRLFAFGYDAWLLVAYLDHLATDPNASVPGATGRLRLDGFGNIVRTPAWSTWSGESTLPLGDAGG